MSLTTENTKIFTESTERIRLNELSGKIIGLAIEVHNALGPGLLESSYKECLYYRIGQSGLFVEKEKPMPSFLRT